MREQKQQIAVISSSLLDVVVQQFNLARFAVVLDPSPQSAVDYENLQQDHVLKSPGLLIIFIIWGKIQ